MLTLAPVTASGLLTPPVAISPPPMTLRRRTSPISVCAAKLIAKTPVPPPGARTIERLISTRRTAPSWAGGSWPRFGLRVMTTSPLPVGPAGTMPAGFGLMISHFGEERGDEVACGSRRHDDQVSPLPTEGVFDGEASQRCTIAERQDIADERRRAPDVPFVRTVRTQSAAPIRRRSFRPRRRGWRHPAPSAPG